MKAPFIRNPYNYDLDKASDESAYVQREPSLTIQSQAIDTDINEIMRRVGAGAPLPQNFRIPSYADWEHVTDYRSALDALRAADEDFLRLPADIRETFQNDPQLFLDAVQHPQTLQMLKDKGIPLWNLPKQDTNNVANEQPKSGGTAPATPPGPPTGATPVPPNK